jgi:transcriptional regulator with XRE-family HTH domain
MTSIVSKFSELIKEVRKQLGLSQEGIARELSVSFATINRWENGKTVPFKMARNQFDAFCTKMIDQGKLKLPRGEE